MRSSEWLEREGCAFIRSNSRTISSAVGGVLRREESFFSMKPPSTRMAYLPVMGPSPKNNSTWPDGAVLKPHLDQCRSGQAVFLSDVVQRYWSYVHKSRFSGVAWWGSVVLVGADYLLPARSFLRSTS